jgi:ATP-dependent DNA helicase RecQ
MSRSDSVLETFSAGNTDAANVPRFPILVPPPRRPIFTEDTILALAHDRLGFERLRPGQLEAVESVLSGRDTLCVMSTGYGKSAIYELAGLMLDGPTVVVSPLIALQRDQMESIDEGEGLTAGVLNSTLSRRAREEALEEAEEGELEFLLMAPEQLAKPHVLADLRQARPSLVVVDEAHCVSRWGHDFRPDYLRLGAGIKAVGRPTVLALTATAAPPVRADIVAELALRDPAEIVRGFDRPNIHLAVERFYDARHKREAVLAAVAGAEPPGIVYVGTKRVCEDVARALRDRGVNACAYHGGLSGRRRNAVQEEFMSDSGCDVVVATVAFGMGIDKPNVRWIFHEHISDSLDSYYQEVGRAGRDGSAAEALLFYRPEDLGLHRFFSSGGLAPDEIERVASVVSDADGPVSAAELLGRSALSRTKLATAVHRLEQAGGVAVEADGTVEATASRGKMHDAAQQAAAAEAERQSFERSRVDMMRAYAERRACRRTFLLGYFGEGFDPPCGNCDNCDRGLGKDPVTASGFTTGQRVAHAQWGEGTVTGTDHRQITVVFDTVGYKTLAEQLVADRKLLHGVSTPGTGASDRGQRS